MGEGWCPLGSHSVGGSHRYVLVNAGEPLNKMEAEQMMKEADTDGGGTIKYESEQGMGPGSLVARQGRAADLSLAPRVHGHDDRKVLQAGSVGAAAAAVGGLPEEGCCPLLAILCPHSPGQLCGQ